MKFKNCIFCSEKFLLAVKPSFLNCKLNNFSLSNNKHKFNKHQFLNYHTLIIIMLINKTRILPGFTALLPGDISQANKQWTSDDSHTHCGRKKQQLMIEFFQDKHETPTHPAFMVIQKERKMTLLGRKSNAVNCDVILRGWHLRIFILQ